LLRTVVIPIEANIVVYVEKNQIQYRPHRNRSRNSLSQYTVYGATTRKSCRAWASNARFLITSAGSDYPHFFAIVIQQNRVIHEVSILRYHMVLFLSR
jgi:hypothetical protein